MMQNAIQAFKRLSAITFFLASTLGLTLGTAADEKPADQRYTAILIWGTDSPKPDDKDLKEVDEKLTEKFKKIFKWTNYYEVKREPVDLKPGESKQLDLSHKCAVKMRLTEKEGMEVELFGEGKSVYKGTQLMPLKDVLILAGDDKNASAWFVVLQPR